MKCRRRLFVGILLGAAALAAENPVGALSLDECLKTAFEKNHRRPISEFAVALAEAQHRQALAGYWPQVGVKAGYERLSDPLNFIFPGRVYAIPGAVCQRSGRDHGGDHPGQFLRARLSAKQSSRCR